MATKIGKFLEKLAKKAGIDTTTEEFKPLLEFDSEMNDEIATKIDKALLTIEAAKSNSEVNKALRQSILGVADAKMDEIITELKLQPGEDFVNEKNTYEKLNKLSKLLFDAGQKKASTDNHAGVHETLKKERDAFAAKEAEYQKQLKEAKDLITSKDNEFKSTRESDLTTFELQKILLGKDYVFPKEMDMGLKVTTALGAVNNELAKKGLVIKRNENGQLAVFDKEGKPGYSESHEPLETATFIDGVLAQNKLLKINDANQNQQQQSNASNGANNNFFTNGPGSSKGNASIMQELDQQLASMK